MNALMMNLATLLRDQLKIDDDIEDVRIQLVA